MSDGKLTAVVVGAGFAGEGHSKALQSADVDVVAICARTPEVVQRVAANLQIPTASTDWAATVREIRPDIVAVATPAGLRTEVIGAACEIGSHVLCDKPLATSSDEALSYYRSVAESGVKHAYAATHRYDPSVAWIAQLLRDGTIGQLTELDLILLLPFGKPTTPWSWANVLAQGGGLLNNGLPHFLGALERMVEGEVRTVVGEARVTRRKAPFVPNLHDWREVMSTELTEEEAAKLEWRDCDADSAFSAIFQVETPLCPAGQTLPVCFRMNFAAPTASPVNGWHILGEKAALVGNGIFPIEVTRRSGDESERLPTPQSFLDDLPHGDGDVQQKWNALARDFVADIRGQTHASYLTFRDGWRYQVIADAIRNESGCRIEEDNTK